VEVTAAPRLRFSFREYLRVDAESSTKHEFLDGMILAMAGGSPDHAALAVAVNVERDVVRFENFANGAFRVAAGNDEVFTELRQHDRSKSSRIPNITVRPGGARRRTARFSALTLRSGRVYFRNRSSFSASMS
jgi:hypothetical protein